MDGIGATSGGAGLPESETPSLAFRPRRAWASHSSASPSWRWIVKNSRGWSAG